MAEVWLAELKGPQGFSRRLVIKRILPHLADDDNFLSMFEDEARLAARLNHPHAVRVEEFGESDGVWYLAMEYLDGGDLRHLARCSLTLNETIPLQVLLQMGGDVASALHHAHTLCGAQGQPLNMIHRDVSPHNILVTTQGQAKLVDFGIARAETNQVKTRTGMVKGKSGYMSPEQALGRKLDGRSDQFALAIVLYETILRARVFLGDNDLAIMRKVVACEIPPLAAIDPNASFELSQVLEKALQRAPEDRFDDCHAFADALFGCLDSSGLRGGHQPVAEWVKRMGEVDGSLAKLPPLDQLRENSGPLEEVTRISRSRSSMQSVLHSQRSQVAAGQIGGTQTGTVTGKTSSISKAPLIVGAAFLAFGLLAWVMTSDNEELPKDLQSATQVKVPASRPTSTDPVVKPGALRLPQAEPEAPRRLPKPSVVAEPKPRPKKAKSTRRAPRKAAVSTQTKARLKVKIRKRGRPQDWGLVYINGRALPGDNPEAMLRVGKHRICVVNQEFGIAWKDSVFLPAAGTRIYVNMNDAKPGTCP
jgi:serine/threonine protein kinase